MRKTGRPPTPEKEQVTVIRLQKKHVDMLDKVIRERAERDLDDVKLGPEERMPGTDVSTWTSYVEPINHSSERRKLVAMLIEKGVSDDALYPTRVVPPVPRAPYSNIDLAAIAEWAAVESKRLTENAPEAIQGVLEQNKLRKMKRELPRRNYIERLKVVTYAAPEDVMTKRRLLDRHQVEHMVRMARSTLYQAMAEGRLPKPIRVSKRGGSS